MTTKMFRSFEIRTTNTTTTRLGRIANVVEVHPGETSYQRRGDEWFSSLSDAKQFVRDLYESGRVAPDATQRRIDAAA